MKRIEPTQTQIAEIIANAKTGEKSISELSRSIGLGRTTVKRIIKEHELQDLYATHKVLGRTRSWSDEEEYQLSLHYDDRKLGVREIAELMNRSKDDVLDKAKELRLSKKRKLDITDEEIRDIENWDGTMESVEQMASKYGLTVEGMRLRIKRIHRGYKKRTVYPAFPEQPDNELLQLLNNHRLTGQEISDQTGYSPYAVQKYRRDNMLEFKLRKDYNADLSEPEMKCIRILEELDLAFIPHKWIDKYTVDIYLGQHKYIEIHGYRWHSTDKAIEKDNRKRQYLKDNGYFGLELFDYELDNAQEVKDKILNLLAHDKLG